jgi:hypothetical protein
MPVIRKIHLFIFMLLLFPAHGNAFASSASAGKVVQTTTLCDGVVVIMQIGSRTTLPSCATNSQAWAIDATTAEGQVKLASLLTAFSLRRDVTISGTGSCTSRPDMENINYFVVAES